MKNTLRIAVLVSFLVPLAARAQPLWSVTLDENGNGTANGNPLNGVLMADPSGGLAGNVLVYTLPFNFPAGSVGDYLLLEPPSHNEVSDVIRFWGNNQVIFYSELDLDTGPVEPPYPLADTGLPGSYLTPPTYIPPVPLWESGVEGGIQGAIHSAISGDPGYIGAGLGNYTFISDVPEPSTLALVGAGLAGLALAAYRRRSK
jgi:hypothetical protein